MDLGDAEIGPCVAPSREDSAPGHEDYRRAVARGAVARWVGRPGTSAVLFDVGGVFTFPDWAVVQRGLDAIGSISLSASLCRGAHYRAVAALSGSQQMGFSRPWESYYSVFSLAIGAVMPGHADMLRALFEEMDGRLWRDVAAENVDVAKRLARTGVRVGVLSNADGTVECALRDLGVCQVGDGPLLSVEFVIDSATVGLAKPDPRIFRLASDRLGVDPKEVVYVGDNLWVDVMGAQRAGMHAVLLDPQKLHPHVASRIDSLMALERR